jgi:hypothetical protein
MASPRRGEFGSPKRGGGAVVFLQPAVLDSVLAGQNQVREDPASGDELVVISFLGYIQAFGNYGRTCGGYVRSCWTGGGLCRPLQHVNDAVVGQLAFG